MSVHGSRTVNAQSSTPKSTTSLSHSRARLLFNSDGSVKLLGDPALFGIDPQSHVLVPTIGVDGTMTMLLAPTGSHGKTFILSPTNGGTLPCLNTVLPTSTINPPLIIAKPTVQKNSPTVLTPAEMKALPKKTNQTSLLQSSKFVTHMRIDPTGSCVSKIRVPVDKKTTSASSSNIPLRLSHSSVPEGMVGSTLKAIAEHLKSKSLPENSMSGLRTSDVKMPIVTVRYPVGPVRSESANTSKNISMFVSNSQWTKLDSVIPSSVDKIKTVLSADPDPYSLLSKRRTGDTVGSRKSNASKPGHVILPTVPPSSGIDGSQKPSNDTPPVVAGLVMAPSHTQSTGTGTVPTMIFAHEFGTGLKGSQSVVVGNASKVLSTSTVQSISTSTVSTTSSSVPQNYSYSLALPRQLEQGGTYEQIHPATDMYAVNPMSTTSGIHSQMATLKNPVSQLSVACSENVNSSANVSYCSTESSWELDPRTGLLATQESEANPEEDEILSIKIDSVFSLAMDRDDENSSTHKRRNSDSKPTLPMEIKIKEEAGVSAATLPSEPTQVTCPPCYVVLEQLSTSQIENDTQNMFKCSNYCRLRTLNFLCSLGLVECEPIVHTVRPDTSSKDVGEKYFSQKDEFRSDVTDSHTFGSQRESDSSNVTDKDVCSPEKLVSEHCGPSLNKVRKVEPGSHWDASKVLRFIKLESKNGESRLPLPISVKSLIPKANKAAPRSLLGTTPVKMKTPIPDGSTVEISQPYASVTDALGLTEQAKNQTVTIASTGHGSFTATDQYHPYIGPISATSVVNKMNVSSCQNTLHKPTSELHGRYTIAANTAITSVSTAKPTVMSGSTAKKTNPSECRSTLSKLPLSKVQCDNKKQYYLVTVNGQRILVPLDNNNVSAYLFNGKVGSTGPVLTSVAATVTPSDKSQIKRPPDTSKDPVPAKVQKDSSVSNASKRTYTLPGGVKIKSEPQTRGYGDEDNGANITSGKKPKVKVKKELINSEWEEIWSSGTRPLENPTDVCSSGETLTSSTTKPNVTDKLSSTLTSSSGAVDTGGVDANDVMPELPLMKLPSTEDIAKKSAAQETRIEKLKATLKEKELLIEQLKRERVEKSISIDDDAMS